MNEFNLSADLTKEDIIERGFVKLRNGRIIPGRDIVSLKGCYGPYGNETSMLLTSGEEVELIGSYEIIVPDFAVAMPEVPQEEITSDWERLFGQEG